MRKKKRVQCRDCGRDVPAYPVLSCGRVTPLCRRHYLKRSQSADRSVWRRVLQHLGV